MIKFLNKETDLTRGNLIKKIIIFTIPLLLTTIFTLLYQSTDLIIINFYKGDASMAAVGSTNSLVNLIVNLFIGISLGANVTIGQAIGKKDLSKANKLTHNAILLAIISGIIIAIIGCSCCKYFLIWMKTPSDVLPKATTYLTIYFIGAPFLMLYNFGASILRSIGETLRPLIILLISGITNILLNLMFVGLFNMDVEGVAIATIVSQALSSLLILICLFKKEDDSPVKLRFKNLKLTKEETLSILQKGLPSGIQYSIFSISNVLISSSINSFGQVALSGNVAASNIEGYVYSIISSLSSTIVAFSAQNYGAKKIDNLNKILKYTLIIGVISSFIAGVLVILLRYPLLGLFSKNKDSLPYGVNRLIITCSTYWICAIMNIFAGYQRGLNQSMSPTIITLTFVTTLRIIFIFTMFTYIDYFHTLDWIMMMYPITWFIASIVHGIAIIIKYKKIKKEFKV